MIGCSSPSVRSRRGPASEVLAERNLRAMRAARSGENYWTMSFPFGEDHLRKLLRSYIEYHHEDRTHLGPNKDCPVSRAIESQSGKGAEVVALPRVGSLHHRYEWRTAA